MFKSAIQYTNWCSRMQVKATEDINNCSYVVKKTKVAGSSIKIKKTVLRDSLFYLYKTG
jgi:hypothetical protein